MSSKPVRSPTLGRTSAGCNLVSNQLMYSVPLICYKRCYYPIRSSAMYPTFSAQRNLFKNYSIDNRPPWNSSTHTGNRLALPGLLAAKRSNSAFEELKDKNERLAAINQPTNQKESSSLARESTWAFYLLDVPKPIRSTSPGYTNARRVILSDGSEFCNPHFAGLPNDYSNSVANCLNGIGSY